MFQINIKLRFALMALSLVAGIVLQFTLGFGYSFIFWLLLIVLTVGYFLLGTIGSAGKMLNEGNIVGAEKQLEYIKKPEWLLKMYRSYYYMLKGSIEMQKKNTDEGERLMLKAQEIGLQTDNDKALVWLNLANLSYNKRKFQQATNYLRELKKLNVTEPMIVQQIAQMEQALRVKPNMSQMMMMQGKGMKGMRSKAMRQQPGQPTRKNNRKRSSKRKKKK